LPTCHCEKNPLALKRRQIVAAARRGSSLRTVAKRFGVALGMVSKWVHRAHGQRLDRVDWQDRPRGNPRPPNRTPRRIVQQILHLRTWLKCHSALGEYGAAAIRAQLQIQHASPLPSTRTIGRILARHGKVQRQRIRRPAPPPGWYLPALANGQAELDAVDIIEGLVIRRGREVQVFNTISLYGSLAASWPRPAVHTLHVLAHLVEHWRRFGAPHYVQFDNDTRFQGTHRHPHCLGRLVHFCLCMGVVPLFVPPQETGFQAKIESYNALWQQKVWQRWRHRSIPSLRHRSERFVAAHRAKHAVRIESAPTRLALPHPVLWREPTQPWILFLRRTDRNGQVRLLHQIVPADRYWPHRLVRAELHALTGELRLYALRRHDPAWQPLLRTTHLEVKLSLWR
jgi:transposase-like protein